MAKLQYHVTLQCVIQSPGGFVILEWGETCWRIWLLLLQSNAVLKLFHDAFSLLTAVYAVFKLLINDPCPVTTMVVEYSFGKLFAFQKWL